MTTILHRICRLKGVRSEAKLRSILDRIKNYPIYVNTKDEHGRTPLSYFLENCDVIDQELEETVLEIIDMFLEHLDLTLIDNDGNSILYYTRTTRTYKIGDILLRYYIQDRICDLVDPTQFLENGLHFFEGRGPDGTQDGMIPGHIVVRMIQSLKNEINELKHKIDSWNDIF